LRFLRYLNELGEKQASVLPYGPIGFVCPKIEVDSALPVELTEALGKCIGGQMRTGELMEVVQAYILRTLDKKAVPNMIA
jgi:hypothetical protein